MMTKVNKDDLIPIQYHKEQYHVHSKLELMIKYNLKKISKILKNILIKLNNWIPGRELQGILELNNLF